jgi:hypothetical protein
MGTGFDGGLNMKFSGPSFLTQGFQHQWFRAVRNLYNMKTTAADKSLR